MIITLRDVRLLFSITAFTISFRANAQTTATFSNPLDIPITLASNFGEVRANHFHTGYDIRTNGKTGYAVHAAADGYVSRIKVSAVGFGNVIYITHPNGYMTVYGHLDHFNVAIAKYVEEQQYGKQSFEVELYPDADMFPVKRGQLVAYSGNSGGSEGPHLHFEIRDASGETYPLNPAKFLPLADHVAPKFKGFFLYPLTKCCGQQPGFGYSVSGSGKNFHLVVDTIYTEYDHIGFGAIVDDYLDGATNTYGVYSLTALVDGKPIFNMKLDKIVFANGRYVNAHIDYREKMQQSIVIDRMFLQPGDENKIYHDLVNDGIFSLNDTLAHRVKIVAADIAGNTAELSFYIRNHFEYTDHYAPTDYQQYFKWNEANTFAADNFKMNLPANVLYDDLYFHYSVIPVSESGYYSPMFQVQDPYTPLHNFYDIYIKPKGIPDQYKTKAVIVYQDQKGKQQAKTTRWEGDYLKAQAREFGSFFVRLDTTAPQISTAVKQGASFTSGEIHFKTFDNLSGIVSYKALLDGKWILMEYDPKNNLLTIPLDDHVPAGTHTLKVTVTDDVNNASSYSLSFKKM